MTSPAASAHWLRRPGGGPIPPPSAGTGDEGTDLDLEPAPGSPRRAPSRASAPHRDRSPAAQPRAQAEAPPEARSAGPRGAGGRLAAIRRALASWGRGAARRPRRDGGESSAATRTRSARSARSAPGAALAGGRASQSPSGPGQSSSPTASEGGFFAQLQFAREARDLELALQRSLAEDSPSGRAPGPAERLAERAVARAIERDGRTGGPNGRPGSRVLASSWGPDGDSVEVLTALSAIGRRAERREEGTIDRWERGLQRELQQSSSSSAHGPHGRDLSHARHVHSIGRPHSFPMDGQDKALQEAIEQSKRLHLITNLPTERYAKKRHRDLTECELCLVDYEVGDELMRLPCMHLFHAGCVSPWLRKSYTCPVCQTDLAQAVGL